MSEPLLLAGRIRVYLDELKRVVDRAVLLSQKAQSSGDDGYWDGVALNLHSFYNGAEKVFEDIVRTMDGNLPSGADWHTSLLIQMSAEVHGQRPAVISDRLRYILDEYRGFRHIVRNVYAFNFRPARLKELSQGLPDAFNASRQELLTFVQFLEALKD